MLVLCPDNVSASGPWGPVLGRRLDKVAHDIVSAPGPVGPVLLALSDKVSAVGLQGLGLVQCQDNVSAPDPSGPVLGRFSR